MPIVKSLMANLKKEYGSKKGKDVYYGMEAKGKIPMPTAKKVVKKVLKKKMPSFHKYNRGSKEPRKTY